MKSGWFERLVEVIEADDREYKAISQAAGLGQNYVQQLVKDGKDPTIGKFLAIMDVLGERHIEYIMTGARRQVASPEAALRSALIAYGVDRSQLELALGIIEKFLPKKEAVGRSKETPSDDQSQLANPRHVSTPSR